MMIPKKGFLLMPRKLYCGVVQLGRGLEGRYIVAWFETSSPVFRGGGHVWISKAHSRDPEDES
jgi:hypothetical protein